MTHEERMQIFEQIDIGCVTDGLIRFGVGGWTKHLRPVNSAAKIYGRAFTAKFDIVTPPREMITPMEVIDMSEPGDILVWNANLETNLMGGNIFAFAVKHGANGIVLDGYNRDSGEIDELGGAVFSRGSSCGSSPVNFKATRDTINIPVNIDGVTVRPGDYVCGDRDGVMVIPYEYVDLVLAQAQKYMEWESRVKEAINNGYNAQQMKAVYASIELLDCEI